MDQIWTVDGRLKSFKPTLWSAASASDNARIRIRCCKTTLAYFYSLFFPNELPNFFLCQCVALVCLWCKEYSTFLSSNISCFFTTFQYLNSSLLSYLLTWFFVKLRNNKIISDLNHKTIKSSVIQCNICNILLESLAARIKCLLMY